MIYEIEEKIKELNYKNILLNKQIQKLKTSLQNNIEELKEFEERKKVLLDEKNLKTVITVQDLYDKLEKAKQHPRCWTWLHTTPFKLSDLSFFKDKIDNDYLDYRYAIILDICYDKEIKINRAYLAEMSSMKYNGAYHYIINQETEEQVDLDKIFKTYVKLRNEYIETKTEYKDDLIPIKLYYESKKEYFDINNSYLKIIRKKDDYELLDAFARVNHLNTNGYYSSIKFLNKEQLHDLAQTIRDNKEQLFRWILSYKWTDQMDAKVEFDMTPVFKLFEKYGVYIATIQGCLGYGKHWNCQFTLDGRKYRVEY